MANLVWLLGAGASAPFGIPTMQQMVVDFETELNRRGSTEEVFLYHEISGFLKNTLGRPVDLEVVFTIVDSFVHWSPDRLGLASLYHSLRLLKREGQKNVALIEKAYGELFDTLTRDLTGGRVVRNSHWAPDNQAIFTTNYDATLEHYWVDCVRVSLNTGFQWNDVIGMKVSRPDNWRDAGYPKLFKLHGSVTWLNDAEYGLTEQRVVPRDMKKWTDSKFLGQVMLYPIEEKELYVEPYLTMFEQLNRELASTQYWIVVGYSFADRFIRDIFIRNSRETTRMAILHPHADQIAQRLEGLRGRIVQQPSRFGEPDSIAAYDTIVRNLR